MTELMRSPNLPPLSEGRPSALAGGTTSRRAEVKPQIAGALGRPTYLASGLGGQKLSRQQSFRLLAQFYQNVPVLGRAIDILAGFVGTPKIVIEGNEAATKEANEWAESVPVGYIGQGLKTWLPDHLRQCLLYGYGVGEAAPSAARDEVERLWSYDSRAFTFTAAETGAFEIVQSGGVKGETTLNPLTLLHTVHRPHGCDPHGQSLFFSSHTFCQALLTITHAHQATWQRSGIPTYHVNWQADDPATFNDPNGAIAELVRAAIGNGWNESIKSQAVDGLAKDFYSTGKVTITAIGADIEPLNVEVGVRAVLEEIIAGTGVPPFLFGLQWATTERLSSVQADMLATTIDILRFMAEGSLRKLFALRQRLKGDASALKFSLEWCDISLQDLEATARAEMMEAQSKLACQKFERQLWADGVHSQEDYAEKLTGKRKVAQAYSEPPAALPGGTDPPVNQQGVAAAFAEMLSEYPQMTGECSHGH